MSAPTVPQTSEYVRALRQIEATLPPSYREMLRVRYEMPGRITTARIMADSVGYETFNAATLHYDKLGRMIAETLGIMHPRLVAVATLAEFVGGVTNSELLWVLRREVVEALEELGWVAPLNEQLPLYPNDVCTE